MTSKIQQVVYVPTRVDARAGLPVYANPGDAGADLTAAIEAPVVIYPGERKAIGTGLAFAVPEGYEIQVRPRSGLALKHGVTVLNSPGTIDAGYRGEVRVILVNLDPYRPFTVEPGMRIAQAVLAPVTYAQFVPVADLDESVRGTGGFGSSGL